MIHSFLIALSVTLWLGLALCVILSEVRGSHWPKYKIGFIDFHPWQFNLIWCLWPVWLIPLALYGLFSGNVWRSIKRERVERLRPPPPALTEDEKRAVQVDLDVCMMYPHLVPSKEKQWRP